MGWWGDMWEVDSASPSTGLSSGRGSSLGPLSEREQRMPGSHVHHLLDPMLQKSGQTSGRWQAGRPRLCAWHSDPMGLGILILYRHLILVFTLRGQV